MESFYLHFSYILDFPAQENNSFKKSSQKQRYISYIDVFPDQEKAIFAKLKLDTQKKADSRHIMVCEVDGHAVDIGNQIANHLLIPSQ